MAHPEQHFRITPEGLPPDEVIFGSSPLMRSAFDVIRKTSDTVIPVLVRGETGTGKELIARYIHIHSQLRECPFVKVNCAAIPAQLLESELLGYEKGAFTGAENTRPGLVELASGGTLFLDEIGDMETGLQAKMLHLLQEGRYTPIGATVERHARVRIICATHRDLEQALNEGSFRSDLFYRIDGVTIKIPPLRDRREDIPVLCEYFRERMNQRFDLYAPPLSELSLYVISQLPWSGNIRELEGWVMRQVVFGAHRALSMELSRQRPPAGWTANNPSHSAQLKLLSRESAQAAERALILKHLADNDWNRRATARDLHISYRSLMYKLREAGLPSLRRKAQRSDHPL